MDNYAKRRLVSWICVALRKGLDLDGVLALAAARKPPHNPQWIREMYPHAVAACKNAAALNSAKPTDRLCDICRIITDK